MASNLFNIVVGANTIHQIESEQFATNIQTVVGRCSGNTYIDDFYLDGADPTIDITTTDVLNALTNFRTATTETITIADGTTVQAFFKTRASGGTFETTATHLAATGTNAQCKAVFVPMSVSAPETGYSTFNGQIFFLSPDGVTNPIRVASGLTPPACAAGTTCFRQGPVVINGNRIPEQISYDINFGVALSNKKKYAGGEFPTDVFLNEMAPTMTVTNEAFSVINDHIQGTNLTSLSVFLRRMRPGTTSAPEADLQHIEFSFTGGMIFHGNTSMNGTTNGSNTLTIQGKRMTVNTGVAIPP